MKFFSNKLNLESVIKYGSKNHNGIFKIAYKSNKEKKGGPCVYPIEIFPQVYTIHALKQHKMLVVHDKLTKGCSVIYKNPYTLSIYKETDET